MERKDMALLIEVEDELHNMDMHWNSLPDTAMPVGILSSWIMYLM